MKIKGSPVTKNIKVFFITLDEDGDLVIKKPTKKSRAITKAIRSKYFDILKLL